MNPHASAPSAAPALRSAVINLSSPTMSPGPALALSVVNAVEVEWVQHSIWSERRSLQESVLSTRYTSAGLRPQVVSIILIILL